MNLLEFVKVLFLKVLQLHRGLRDVVYNAANVCEPHFVTGKSCDVFPAGDTRIAALQVLKTIAT